MVLRRREWSLSAVSLAALLAAVPATEARAQAQAAYAVDVPAGSLESALLDLARQTEHQLFFSKDLVAGRKAAALKGRFAPEDAAARLVAGADLTVSRAGPHLLVLARKPPAPATRQPAQAADEAVRPFATAQLGGAAPAAPDSGPVRAAPILLDEVQVTGSNIRGAPLASPLLVIDQEALAASGHATVAEALRALPENFGGGAGEGNSLAGADPVGRNTSFGSGINLRGLGNGATLVLVNGRRLAGSGTFGDYADVSSIPTAAVARVEVLLDGASAIYGSDAVGGVVNIITRKDYEGAEVRALAGIGTSGEPAQGQASVTVGRRWAGGGLVLSYELQRRERLAAEDRDFAANADLRPFGGSDFRGTNSFPGNVLLPVAGTNTLAPAFAIPAGQAGVGLRPGDFLAGVVNRQNQRLGVDVLPRQTVNAVYAAVDQEVGEGLVLTADGRFSARRYKARFAPAVSSFTVGRNNPFFVSPTGAASHQIAYSFAGELPNVISAGNVESLALTAGATLRLDGDWRSEAYGAFAQELTEVRGRNLVNFAILAEALGNVADRADTAFSTARDGFFNPFSGVAGSNPVGVMGAIGSGSTFARIRSRVSTVNVQADGSLFSLPGGRVKLAVGAQARRESLVRSGFNQIATVAPAPTAPTDVSRDVTAAFAELRVPLFGEANARPGMQQLELSLAGRLEHYEAVGTSFRPKVGLVWGPTDDLLLRATYSRSFRAPALRELYDPALYNPTSQPLGTGRILVLQLAGGNPDLKPESADSWTVGVDFEPAGVPGLKLSLTAFDIRFKNRIDRPVTASIAAALVDPRLSAFVRRISPGTNPADLALITELLNDPALSTTNGVFLPAEYGAVVDSRYVNTAALHVRGVDGTASYGFDLGEARVRLGANASYLFSFEQQFTPTAAVIERVNVANFPLRFRGRFTADWTRGRLSLGGALNYTGRYRDGLGARIGDQAKVDLQARLAPAERGPMEGVAVLLTVRNVFDADPPFFNNPVGVAYDPANADPIGRFVSLQLSRSW